MPRLLKLTRLGNPILRKVAKKVVVSEIKSKSIQGLISNIRHTNKVKKYSVGLSAPQVNKSLALSVIGIKPTPNHPEAKEFDSVIINPSYIGASEMTELWEGCQSVGSGNDILYGPVPRYTKIKAKWYDEKSNYHEEILVDLTAHVFQHETDHLNGVIFIDKVTDTRKLMMADEYQKRILKRKKI